jgi:hypothetical protein
MNLVEFDNMNELIIWMELDHIVDLHHINKIYNMVDSNAQRGETWNMDKIDNIHENRNIKNCDCMNDANVIYHVDHTSVTSHVDDIQPNG